MNDTIVIKISNKELIIRTTTGPISQEVTKPVKAPAQKVITENFIISPLIPQSPFQANPQFSPFSLGYVHPPVWFHLTIRASQRNVAKVHPSIDTLHFSQY